MEAVTTALRLVGRGVLAYQMLMPIAMAMMLTAAPTMKGMAHLLPLEVLAWPWEAAGAAAAAAGGARSSSGAAASAMTTSPEDAAPLAGEPAAAAADDAAGIW